MRALFHALLTLALLLPALGARCEEPPMQAAHQAPAVHDMAQHGGAQHGVAQQGPAQHEPAKGHAGAAQHECIGCIAPFSGAARLAEVAPPARSIYAAYSPDLLLQPLGGPRAPPPRG